MTTEIETPVGRIVAGNPLEHRQKIDPKTRQPVIRNGVPAQETYFGLAIQKQGESAWWETEWGALILAAGQVDWPGGESGSPHFAWKITDGDSPTPNKRGNKPCDQEGYPGHWILNCATGLPVRCYRHGKFEAHQVLQPEAKEIKTGDYGVAFLSVRGNQSTESPGVYLNPQIFALVQPGPVIVTESGPDPHEAFSKPPTMPTNALPDPTGGAPAATPPAGAVTPPAATPPAATPPPAAGAPAGAPPPPPAPAPVVQPAPDFLAPDSKRLDSAGNAFTVAQLQQAGYSDEQIKALPVAS